MESRVWRDGVDMGPAPTVATGKLLVALAETYPSTGQRKQLARHLYPASADSAAMNALRQTIYRLRAWLGHPAAVADHSEIGLAPGSWEIIRETGRELASTPLESGASVREAFRELVCRVATLDADAARSVFLGGKVLTDCLSLPHLAGLLKVTRPGSLKDPGAADHLVYYGRYYHQTVQFQRAETAHMRVYKIAEQSRRQALSSHAATWLLFTYVESGDLASARSWLPVVVGTDRTVAGRLFAANARACCLWNDLDYDGAHEQFDKASRLLHHSSRADVAHYWSNYAVFSVEAGDLGRCDECIARTKELWVPGIDVISEHNIYLATALRLRARGDTERALVMLEKLRESESARGHTLGVLYEMEVAAECQATLGHKNTALRLWNEAESTRNAGGGKLTPRLQAMKHRIRELAG